MVKQLKFLTRFLFPVILALFFYAPTRAIRESPLFKEPTSASLLTYNAWYVMSLGNIPIGILTASTDDPKTGMPSTYTAQFSSRIGASPLLSSLKGEIVQDEKGDYSLTQTLTLKTENGVFKNSENTWIQQEQGPLKIEKNTGADWHNIFPINIKMTQPDHRLEASTRLLYFANNKAQTKSEETFIPFTGSFIRNDYFKSKYDDDGFLNNAELYLEGKGKILISRIDPDQLESTLKTINTSLIDFGWLTSNNSLTAEFDTLTKFLVVCKSSLTQLSAKITNEMPENSYLSYRRMINTLQLCSDMGKALEQARNASPNDKLNIIGTLIKNLMKESPHELPYSITSSSDISLFYDDTVSFLWPRITSLLIRTTLKELNDNFELEKNRKALVGILLNMTHMQSRSVFRAQIQLLDSPLNFKINTTLTSSMSSSSLKNLGKVIPKSLPSIYLNGQYFATVNDLNFNDICAVTNGKIGIDFGDAPEMITNTDKIRGVWDFATRLNLARQFAIQASIAKNCNEIIFLSPIEMHEALNKTIEQFKGDLLGIENELLLSNDIQKSIWTLPGKYRLVITSLVSGKVLAAQEFTVVSGLNTKVTAKIY